MLFSRSDVKYTLRQLANNPGFALLSVLVLAGGLGLSLFIFTFTYIMAYKPISLPHGESIVEICVDWGDGCEALNAFEFATFRDDITALENIGIYSDSRIYVESDNVIHKAAVTATEWNMFQLSESSAHIGRVLQETDQLAQSEPVAVLAWDFWQLATGGDPSIINGFINLGNEPTRVVGVMPEGFKFPQWADVWIPAPQSLLDPAVNDMTMVSAYGRLTAGVSRAAASSEIRSLMQRMRQQYPPDPSVQYTGNLRFASEADSGFVTTIPFKPLSNFGSQLALLVANVMGTIIFLLACINIGTLMLARTNEGLKDLSIRVALGAPRLRLLLQTMAESVAIAVVGALLAVLLAGLGLEAMNLFLTTLFGEEGLQFWWDFGVGGSTVIAAVLFVVLTVLVTSAIPAWKLINGNFNVAMRDGTRGAVGLRTGRFSKSLVLAAITLITIFLYVGTIAIHALWSTGSLYRVVDSTDMHSIEIDTQEQFGTAAERLQFFRSLQTRLRNHSDVQDVMMIGLVGDQTIAVDGRSYLSEEDKPVSPVQTLSGDLRTIGATLLEGRYFSEQDDRGNSRTALISQSLAERLWPGQSPVGRSLRIGSTLQGGAVHSFRVIGMTTNTPVDGRISNVMFEQQSDMIYLPLGQSDSTDVTATIRSNAAQEAVALILRDAVLGLNSGVSFNIISWVENQQALSSVIRFGVSLFASCGAFAFLISIAGIFGLTKNSVVLRTQEIGTRQALGAPDGKIRRTFTLAGARQVLFGIALAGLACAPLSFFLIQTFGFDYLMPGFLSSIIVLLALLSCVVSAIYFPIRRLLLREPAELLHHQ